jgi:hypothetical protein
VFYSHPLLLYLLVPVDLALREVKLAEPSPHPRLLLDERFECLVRFSYLQQAGVVRQPTENQRDDFARQVEAEKGNDGRCPLGTCDI